MALTLEWGHSLMDPFIHLSGDSITEIHYWAGLPEHRQNGCTVGMSGYVGTTYI